VSFRFSKFAMLATLMSAAFFSVNAPAAFGQQGYVQYYDPSAPLPRVPVVLDTRMKPTYVRSREIIDSTGTVSRVVEPIIQERFERVSKPMMVSETMMARKAVATTQSVAPLRSAYHVRRTHIASAIQRHHHMASGMRHQHIASTSGVSEHTVLKEKVVSSAAIIERRDPALNVLDQASGPAPIPRARVRVTETY